MKRTVRWIGIIAVVLLLVVAGLAFFVNANQFRPMLEAELTNSLGREVKLGDLKMALLSGGISASDLSVADDPSYSRTPFLQAKSFSVGVKLIPLILSRRLNVTALTIEKPEILLVQAPSGEWNFSSLGKKRKTAAGGADLNFSVKLIQISKGRLTVRNPKQQIFEDVDLEVNDFSPASACPFSLSIKIADGGLLKLRGKAGPIDAADASLTPLEATLGLTNLNLVTPGFTGLLTVDGTGSSNGRRMQAKGSVKAERWRVAAGTSLAPKPVQFDFVVDHDVRKRAGVLSQGAVRFGKVSAALGGTYSLRTASPLIHMKMTAPNMPIPELEAMLPALGIVLPAGSSLQGGTASARVAMDGVVDQLVSDGSVALNQTRLAGFDLGGQLKAIAAIAGIKAGGDTDIEKFSADFHRSAEGTAVEALHLIVPTIGELTGGGSISPSQALDFKMNAKLHTSGNLMVALGQKGDTNIPFFVRGTGSAPSFVPDVRGIASEKIKTFLNGDDPAAKARGLLEGFFGRKKTN